MIIGEGENSLILPFHSESLKFTLVNILTLALLYCYYYWQLHTYANFSVAIETLLAATPRGTLGLGTDCVSMATCTILLAVTTCNA